MNCKRKIVLVLCCYFVGSIAEEAEHILAKKMDPIYLLEKNRKLDKSEIIRKYFKLDAKGFSNVNNGRNSIYSRLNPWERKDYYVM